MKSMKVMKGGETESLSGKLPTLNNPTTGQPSNLAAQQLNNPSRNRT